MSEYSSDPGAGVFSLSQIRHLMRVEFGRAQRYGYPLSCLVISVDRLDSLRDLVTYLGSVREERKAILAVSDGWLLFKPDSSMTTLRQIGNTTEPIPGNEPERFATNYRKAGGKIEVLYIDHAARTSPTSYDPVAAFFHREMPVLEGQSARAA